MSKLRAYLEQYVQDLTAILAQATDDDTILDLAEEKWALEDARLLAIKAVSPGQLFIDSDGGQNIPDKGDERNVVVKKQ
ncbi:MAG: hypothetical protein BWK78_01405 [Thiotrichaceae bacterium IS1]|nr:MAG: hypothetical protein BWK78_01405 [Thiotrichaceae bacterium IS1]